MSSPAKGVERLAEELKFERQKATNALSDRGRLRVEIESLKKDNEEKREEIESLNELCNNERNLAETLQNELDESRAMQNALHNDLTHKIADYNNLYNEHMEVMSENQANQNLLHEKDIKITQLTIKCDSLEGRGNKKDELLNQLKAEIYEVRQSQMENEQVKMNLYEELKQQKQWNEELKSKLQAVDIMESSYSQTRSSNDELRTELEQALNANATLMEQMREMSTKLGERSADQARLEESIRSLQDEKAFVLKELQDSETTKDQISERIQAEIEASTAAREMAEAASRGREFLDRQLHELQEAHRASLSQNTSLEDQLTTAKTTVADLQAEVFTLRGQVSQAQSAVDQASNMDAMVMEIDSLRMQLNDVRRQLIRRDLEDEAGVMPPQMVSEREAQGRQVLYALLLVFPPLFQQFLLHTFTNNFTLNFVVSFLFCLLS
jgi:chromosome segregation ATPase